MPGDPTSLFHTSMPVRLRGPLASYELWHWAADHVPALERVWLDDPFEAMRLLRTLLEQEPSHSLRALVFEFEGASAQHLDAHELIERVAVLVARRQIRVFRKPLVVMASELAERPEHRPYEPSESEIEEFALVLPVIELVPLPTLTAVHEIAPPPAVIAFVEILGPPALTALVEVLSD
jgi:hypothetical protein